MEKECKCEICNCEKCPKCGEKVKITFEKIALVKCAVCGECGEIWMAKNQ